MNPIKALIYQAAENTADSTFIEPDYDSIVNFSHPDWKFLIGDFIVYSILAGIIVAFIIWSIWRLGRWNKLAKARKISLKWFFIPVWIYGFLVYDIGMCPSGEKVALLTNAPMAFLYAFRIFLFNSDVSEIQNKFHESWVYSFNFALCHFFAAIISTLFVIKLVGFHLVARWNIWWKSLLSKWRKVDETFIFWGFNEASYRLVMSIHNHYGSKANRKLYRIVVVRMSIDDETDEQPTGFSRIFDFLSVSPSEMARFEEIKSLGIPYFTTGRFVDVESYNSDREEDILGRLLKIRSVRRFIKYGTRKKVHMLFLSDDENDNLHALSLLRKDTSINEFAKTHSGNIPQTSVCFYCHARANSVHDVIETHDPYGPLKVRLIDSSHINVELLKENPELLPANFVEVEKDATVSSLFHGLIIGFSEVGKDAVRFLYEFGAFVRSGVPEGKAPRSSFHLDVVDRKMADLAGSFVANSPAIRPYMPFVDKKEYNNPNALVSLYNYDCRSADFYILLNKLILTLNYIVIATDDDELNITMGVRIFKAATRYRQNLDNLCILVRIHNDDDNRIRNIAKYYNTLWYGDTDNGDKLSTRPLHIFGLDHDIYTYKNIIELIHEEKALKYKQRYDNSIPPNEEQTQKKTQTTSPPPADKKEPGNQKYIDYLQQRRGWLQNVANSCHEQTKKMLLDKALEKCGLDRTCYNGLKRKLNSIQYDWNERNKETEDAERIAYVLAQTEHLRWNASHEIMGYEPGPKDEIRLNHDCMIDWYALPTDKKKSYDCNVADMVLGVKIIPPKL